MSREIILRMILEKSVAGVEYGVQKGKGTVYETIQKQKAGFSDLVFKISVIAKMNDKGGCSFSGPFVHGKWESGSSIR